MLASADATARRADAHRLVFLHGFTQTHHHWHEVAFRLAARLTGWPALAFVDLPGHGLAATDRTGIDDVAERLTDLAGPGTYVGYSMGGRMALAAALDGAPGIERLILVGATAGIDDHAERTGRQRLDDERARHLEDVGLDTFLDEWLATPMFAGLPPDPEGLAHRRRNTVAGLAHSLRTAGTGAQTPGWSGLGQVRIPVLVVAGERDDKFSAIGRRLTDGLAGATFATVPGAGHAAHTERPDEFADLVVDWLSRVPGQR